LTVLALATLGDVTKNRNNPIFCRVAQELSLVTVAGIIALDFANVNTALMQHFSSFKVLALNSLTCI
jgi:hypothetical protein